MQPTVGLEIGWCRMSPVQNKEEGLASLFQGKSSSAAVYFENFMADWWPKKAPGQSPHVGFQLAIFKPLNWSIQ